MRLLLVILLLLSSKAFSASGGQLNLRAQVPAIVSIQINPTTLAGNLPLNITQSRSRVADSVENWNTLRGTRIRITSANRGNLVHNSIATSRIPYTLYFWGINVNLAGSHIFIRSQVGVRALTNAVELSYTGVPLENLNQGDYSDVVTFTISAN